MGFFSFVWKDTSRRSSELILVLIGIAFGIAAIFILFSLRSGIENALFEAAQRKNPLSEITVYGASGSFLKVLGVGNQQVIDDETIKKFEQIPAVRSVATHTVYQNLASVEVEVFDQIMQTDSLIFGISRDAIDEELPKNEKWNASASPVPVLISRKLLDFYNLSLGPSANLPPLNEDAFKSRTIKIMPGYSSFFPNRGQPKKIIEGQVVGFSNRVDLIGVTLPIDAVRELNTEEGISKENYNKVFLTLDSPRSVDAVSKQIEANGYRVSSLQKEFKEIDKSLQYVELILFILSGTILAISVLLIGNGFWHSLSRRGKEFGILRAIGATRRFLTAAFITEAAFIGLIGGGIGLAFGKAATLILQNLLNKNFSLSSISIDSLFPSPLSAIIYLLLFSATLSILASLPPILKTFRQSPRSLFVK